MRQPDIQHRTALFFAHSGHSLFKRFDKLAFPPYRSCKGASRRRGDAGIIRRRIEGHADRVLRKGAAREPGLQLLLGREVVVLQLDLIAGRLVRPLPEAMPAEFAYWIVCRKSIAESPKVTQFRSWLIDQVQDDRTALLRHTKR